MICLRATILILVVETSLCQVIKVDDRELSGYRHCDATTIRKLRSLTEARIELLTYIMDNCPTFEIAYYISQIESSGTERLPEIPFFERFHNPGWIKNQLITVYNRKMAEQERWLIEAKERVKQFHRIIDSGEILNKRQVTYPSYSTIDSLTDQYNKLCDQLEQLYPNEICV